MISINIIIDIIDIDINIIINIILLTNGFICFI